VIGGPRMDNMYHAGWAWAGNTPFRYTKLVASDFGGTRTPMVISWPARIRPDDRPRTQFHHVNDLAPTLYELLGIRPPDVVDGHPQDPIDGVSFAYTFDDPDAPERKQTQYFEIMGSRGLYHEGFMASAFGPRIPWIAAPPDLSSWDPRTEPWELFDTRADVTLTRDLAAEEPERLAELEALFLREARENHVLPIGGGLYVGIHPSEQKRTSNTEWVFHEGMTRIPESQAPNLRNGNLRVEIDARVPPDADGVLFALGGYAGGASLFARDGRLHYEYSSLLLRRTKIDVGPLPEGAVRIAMEMRTAPEYAGPAELTFFLDDRQVARGTVERTVPLVFTASETFDVGMDTGSPVADAYFDDAPFPFEGTLERLHFRNL